MAGMALLFPGQGSQYVGMGKALAEAFPEAREVFAAADDALGFKLSSLCFAGPEEALKLTANTQPAILATSIAAHAAFVRRCPEAALLVAGHSLGEWSALVAVGSLSLADALRAVRARGQYMQDAVPPGAGAMSAVLGLEPEVVARVCAEVAQGQVVSCANFNEPGQTVIAGDAAAIARAAEALKGAGAKRVLPLPVSAPFHCALMEPVVQKLGGALDGVAIRGPRTPVVTNVEAAPNADAERVRALLLAQVTAPVRWTECVRAIEAAGVTRVVELGPGKVLCGLVKRIARGLECFNVEDPASLEKALAGVSACGAAAA